MQVVIAGNSLELGKAAGMQAASIIRDALTANGIANIILATGTSQFETLAHLIQEKDIDWSSVTLFHLDEYIGLPEFHPASFRKYLKERFLSKVPPLKACHLIDGDAEAAVEIDRLNNLISQFAIDVALVGIGENGHLAFNDPPADFETANPYLIVNLDEPCRKQQTNEGWFATLEDVPEQAISMSVKQIMKSYCIICSVPDQRKAQAVKNSLEQDISNLFPASILQQHPNCFLYLDQDSASLVS